MFPNVLQTIILDYAATWKLKPNFPEWLLDWGSLIYNPNAVDYMLANKYETHWGKLASNPNPAGFYYIRDKYPDLLDWEIINCQCDNEDVIQYVCDHMDFNKMRDLFNFMGNPHAIPWLTEHPEHIDFDLLLCNPNGYNLLSQNGKLDCVLSKRDHITDIAQDILYLCKYNRSQWAFELFMTHFDTLRNNNQLSYYENELVQTCAVYDVSDIITWRRICQDVYSYKHLPFLQYYEYDKLMDRINESESLTEDECRSLSINPDIFELCQPTGVFELL